MSISEDWERARAGRTFRLGCNHSKVIRGKNHRPSPMTVVLGEKEMALNTRRSRTSSSNHQCIWHHDLFKWPNGSPDRQPLWRVHFSMMSVCSLHVHKVQSSWADSLFLIQNCRFLSASTLNAQLTVRPSYLYEWISHIFSHFNLLPLLTPSPVCSVTNIQK